MLLWKQLRRVLGFSPDAFIPVSWPHPSGSAEHVSEEPEKLGVLKNHEVQ